MKALTWLLATVTVATGCAAVSTADLADRTFLSQSVTESGTPRPLVGTSVLTLHFRDRTHLGGSAGCNSLDARYSLDDGELVVRDASWTAIGCDAALGEQEDWYFTFLQSSPALTLDGDALTLDGDGTVIEYLDQKVATPDLALVGPLWTVDTIIDGQSAGNAPWPTPATLRFAEGGTVEVSTGCNGGTGTYTVDGNALTFADVAVTERGCPDELSQMLETGVLAVVFGPQPVTWEIKVDRLSLDGGDAGLGLRGTE